MDTQETIKFLQAAMIEQQRAHLALQKQVKAFADQLEQLAITVLDLQKKTNE